MIYIAQLLDGCMDAGSTEITATTIESAIEQSEAWAADGDWHTAGSVVLVLTDNGEEQFRGRIEVPQTG